MMEGFVNSEIPYSSNVDVGVLARLFDERTNSYKFFFFLSLIDAIQVARVQNMTAGKPLMILNLHDLVVDMTMLAWYPHWFCRLSFGPQDKLQEAVDSIEWGDVRGSWLQLGGDEYTVLRERCRKGLDAGKLLRYVPYRLLRSFFVNELRGVKDALVNDKIVDLSESLFETRRPFYCFIDGGTSILINHHWFEYFERNHAIIRGWALFKLAEYLQAKNPNAPAVVKKLIAPSERSSLNAQRSYWKSFLVERVEGVRCVYSGQILNKDDFSLDHYLPWSFIAHDKVWNLIPVSRKINSSKSDMIPYRGYFEPMVMLQHEAVLHAMKDNSCTQEMIDSFYMDLGLNENSIKDEKRFLEAYEGIFFPLENLAQHQGFACGWKYVG